MEGARHEFATVGDNCIDRYLPPVGLSLVGGNAVNVAVNLARLGRRAAYFGAVGDDSDGLRVRECLRRLDVDTAHVRTGPGGTAYTEIGSDAFGERTMLFEDFGACRGYRPDPGEVEILLRMRHVHIGWLDDGGTLKRTLRAAGVSVSQDLSVNADPENVRPDGLSIAFASAEGSRELGAIVMQRLLAEGAKLAVVTCGPLGSMASDGVLTAEADVAPVAVVDTTGAGDTFIAGFLATHTQGRPLRACLASGRDAAASTCMHWGGFPQMPVELR